MSKRAVCGVLCTAEGRHPLLWRAASVPGCPGHALPLSLMVLPKLKLKQRSCWALPSVPPGPGGASTRMALGQLRSFCTLPHCPGEVDSGDPAVFCHTAVGSGQ